MASGPMDAQAPGAPESRTGAFGTGTTEAMSAFGADSAKYNSLVPKGPRLNSVLQPYLKPMNGMSQGDYDTRVLPGMTDPLPSSNGQSTQNYQDTLMMKLRGGEEQY